MATQMLPEAKQVAATEPPVTRQRSCTKKTVTEQEDHEVIIKEDKTKKTSVKEKRKSALIKDCVAKEMQY